MSNEAEGIGARGMCVAERGKRERERERDIRDPARGGVCGNRTQQDPLLCRSLQMNQEGVLPGTADPSNARLQTCNAHRSLDIQRVSVGL